jgi:hypothetical protein
MRRFRFHLGTLIALVLVLGVGFAALRESNETWDSGVFTLAVVILLTSVLLAVHRTEERRAFWLGFALFGVAYLGLSQVPPIASRLITTKVLAFIDSKLPRSMPAGFAYFDYDNDGDMDLYVVNQAQPKVLYLNRGNGTFEDVTSGKSLSGSTGTTEKFTRIGHSLLALIIALLGGRLSGYLYAKNRRPAQGPADSRGSTSVTREAESMSARRRQDERLTHQSGCLLGHGAGR